MADETPRIDRRKQRTQQLLRDALMSLIVEKGYEAITLQDITDRANVARPTFYLHYKSKEELLFTSLREIYDDLAIKQRAITMEDMLQSMVDPSSIDYGDFEHVASHMEFYRTMLSSKGSISFMIQLLEYIETLMQDDVLKPLQQYGVDARLPIEMIAGFMAGAEIGVVNWWIKKGQAYSPQQIGQMMHFLCIPMLAWALGFPSPDSDFRITPADQADNSADKIVRDPGA
ncbi:MAG: TetR/AcrR family transcriptional regulator [Anaerolineae bacterium]|nr:TetR/AcrR family transcriptional regulator [Anaerolineae bacterium]